MTKSSIPDDLPENPDKHDILALVRRRGMSLSGIARDAGRHPSVCAHGIARRNMNGAKIIADALGIDFERLFPGYRNYAHNSDANLSLKNQDSSRQKRPSHVDERAA